MFRSDPSASQAPDSSPYAPVRREKPRHCTQCGCKHEFDYRFCPACGNPVQEPARDPHAVCACATVFSRDDRFCASCGAARPPAQTAPATP